MTKNLTADETVLGLAAAVTSRACELITDGWTKGSMMKKVGGAPVSFCIHGALDLALEEILGENRNDSFRRDVEQVAVAFICDQAFGSIKRATAGIPAATYNDAAHRKHQEVIDVMELATQRLWSVTFDTEGDTFEFSQWANVDEGTASQYLHASLAN